MKTQLSEKESANIQLTEELSIIKREHETITSEIKNLLKSKANLPQQHLKMTKKK